MSETWSFRDGTLDQAIFNAVVLFNEYQLPERYRHRCRGAYRIVR